MLHHKQIEKYLNKKVDTYTHITTWRDYDVYIIDQMVFRFPKTERPHLNIHKEKQLLDIIRPYVTLSIPDYTIVDDNFIVYPLLAWTPLPNDPNAYTDTMIIQLVEFLKQLHWIPQNLVHDLDPWPQHSEPDTVFVQQMKQTLEKRLSGHISKPTLHAIYSYLDALFFDSTPTNPVVVHTDLQGKNMLYDPETKRITGILDFTDARIGNAAVDFCHFFDLSPDLLRKLIEQYRGFRDQTFFNTVFFLTKRTVLFEIMNEKVFKEDTECMLKKLEKYGFIL